MCLYVKQNQEACIADNDITVYKVVFKFGIRNEYLTFFQYAPVKMGELYKSRIGKIKLSYNEKYYIEEGLHSCASLDIARELKRGSGRETVIIKCTIPAGSKYYLGEFREQDDSYVSNRLIYNEIVK